VPTFDSYGGFVLRGGRVIDRSGERRADVVQVVERVLKVLLGKPGAVRASNAEEQTILVVVTHSRRLADLLPRVLVMDDGRLRPDTATDRGPLT